VRRTGLCAAGGILATRAPGACLPSCHFHYPADNPFKRRLSIADTVRHWTPMLARFFAVRVTMAATSFSSYFSTRARGRRFIAHHVRNLPFLSVRTLGPSCWRRGRTRGGRRTSMPTAFIPAKRTYHRTPAFYDGACVTSTARSNAPMLARRNNKLRSSYRRTERVGGDTSKSLFPNHSML